MTRLTYIEICAMIRRARENQLIARRRRQSRLEQRYGAEIDELLDELLNRGIGK